MSNWKRMLTLASRGARHHMGVAMSLITVIPGLVLCYMVTMEGAAGREFLVQRPMIFLCLVGSIVLGYVLLSRYPVNIARLRRYLQDMVNGKLPDKVMLLSDMDDITAIERSLNLIVGQLSTQVQRMEKELTQIEWLLSRRVKATYWKDARFYRKLQEGDPTQRSTESGLILSSVGGEVLGDVVGDFLDLIESFAVVYEKDGKVALHACVSEWSRFWTGTAEGQRVGKDVPESFCARAWAQAAADTMSKREPVDIESPEGTRIFFAPVWTSKGLIGAIGFGYGDPPRDDDVLQELARRAGVDIGLLREKAQAYEKRPPFIVGLAKNRLITAAKLIGEMTERRQAEEELRKHRDHLEELVEERTAALKTSNQRLEREVAERRRAEGLKDEFVSTVSHELRTPLAITKEGIDLLIDGIPGAINDKQRGVLTTAKGNVDRLARIINDLLDISKIEAGKMDLEKTRVDLVGVAAEAVEAVRPLAEQKGLTLSTEFPTGGIDVLADADRIMQVLTNLVANAVKFTQDGSITVSVRREQEGVRCAVRDTGDGIAEEDLPKLFGKFIQIGRTHGAGQKGTGLGLAIAKNIVELHRGQVQVESRLHKGSTFSFVLPFYSEEEEIREQLGRTIEEARKRHEEFTLFMVEARGEQSGAPSDEEVRAALYHLAGAGSLGRATDFVRCRSPRQLVVVADLGGGDAVRLAERWKERIAGHFRDAGLASGITQWWGFARYPHDATNPDELLATARKSLAKDLVS